MLIRLTGIALAGLLLIGLVAPSAGSPPHLQAGQGQTGPSRSPTIGRGPVGTPRPDQAGDQGRDDTTSTESGPATPPSPAGTGPTFVYPASILWANGPLVTHPGGGLGGADASALQTAQGMSTYGFANQFALGYRMADDFQITDPAGWRISSITFFAYQMDPSVAPSTITGVYCQIWNGPPDAPGSSVVWGNLTSNRLITSTWAGIYRTRDTDLLLSDRPIMANRADAWVVLPPGVYWLDWATDGALPSGPWAPPITILGQKTTGNAMQFSGSWAPALDSGSGTPQGMPFLIAGTVYQEPRGVAYLPFVSRNYPLIPAAPILSPISNADGDGNYTVGWGSSAGAETYLLVEDSAPDFSSPTTVYSGPGTSAAIAGRDLGTYYYRVRASNAYGSGAWSNVESVVVTVPPPGCPQAGAWYGATNQGRSLSFVVESSPRCQVAAGSLSITIYNSCGFETLTVFGASYPIVDNRFDADGYTVRVTGEFSSPTAAGGTFSFSMANPSPPPANCTASGTWTAAP